MNSVRRPMSVTSVMACGIASGIAHAITRVITRGGAAVALLALASTLGAQTPSGGLSGSPMDSATPTSQPLFPEQRSVQQIAADYSAVSQNLNRVLPTGILSDPAKRTAAASHAIPIVMQREQLIEELAATRRVQPVMILEKRRENQSLLYLLGDESTVKKVKDLIASSDPARKAEGQSIVLSAGWVSAGSDKTEALAVIDNVEQLDRANPNNSRLTLMTWSMVQNAPAPALHHRLLLLIKDVMTDPLSARLRPQANAQLKAEDESLAAQKAMLNKPFTLAGKTPEGAEVTTSDWKGKVVLVDFWATWCPPCVADIPQLQGLYQQDHTKGLEIIGVCSDYNQKALEDFSTKNKLAWPELFDPNAAANQKWNPLCRQNNVVGFPTTFLIDRKGILRSAAALDEPGMVQKLLEESP